MNVLLALALVALVGASLIEGRAIRDLKSNIITRGNTLLKQAEEAVTKLEAEKKTHEVTIIKTEEAKIKKVIADLEAATDNTKVIHLERELVLAEVRLHHELLKAGHSHATHATTKATLTKRDLKSALVNLSNELLKKAQTLVSKLEAENRKHEATIVKTEVARIKKYVAQLEANTDATKLGQLEHQLLLAELRLESDFRKIEQTHTRTTHAHHAF